VVRAPISATKDCNTRCHQFHCAQEIRRAET
jgi:hypothetical protein